MAAEPQKVTPDGIEPPLSDLESEVLPLHHGAWTDLDTHQEEEPCISHGVVVSTQDSESCDRGSNPRGRNFRAQSHSCLDSNQGCQIQGLEC